VVCALPHVLADAYSISITGDKMTAGVTRSDYLNGMIKHFYFSAIKYICSIKSDEDHISLLISQVYSKISIDIQKSNTLSQYSK